MATDVSIEPQLVPEELLPDEELLVTEDGKPVDGQFSEKQMRLLTEPLYSSWTRPEGKPFVAMCNVGLFYAEKQPPLVPDALLSLDVRSPDEHFLKKNRSYFFWRYGKMPEVVVEVVSSREGGEDTSKLAAYARIGVPYYVIFDPDMQLGPDILRGYRLQVRTYQRVSEPLFFPEVGLGISLWHGPYEDFDDSTWLRWVDANGSVVPTGHEGRETERQRADAERQRAEVERRRADALAEKLSQLGVDPLAP